MWSNCRRIPWARSRRRELDVGGHSRGVLRNRTSDASRQSLALVPGLQKNKLERDVHHFHLKEKNMICNRANSRVKRAQTGTFLL
eukprot:6314828-Amphidinium_carterae.1